MAVATLAMRVDSKDARRATGDLRGLDKSAVGATVAAKGLGKAVGLAGIAIAAAFSSGAIVRTIADFDTSMSRLGAVSRATAGELAMMRDIAKDLGATTEFSATQAADGLNFLAMAGFSASEAMASLPSVLDLATASGMGLAQSADIASNVMSGFGISAENAANVSDVLAAASSRANTDVSQLGQAMSTVAPISATLGIGLEDTAAAIGVLSDAGIQGARAGTAMRGVLASLAGPTDQAQEVLSRLGLTIADINPETNDLATVMGRLGDVGLSTADAITLFGREAASGALVLVEGSKRLGEFGAELRDVDGAALDMAATMRDNLGGDIKGAISAAQGLIVALGDAGLTAVLRGVVQGVTNLVRGVSDTVTLFANAVQYVNQFVVGFNNAELATDNLTIAMGDEINQANALFTLMGNGNTITQSSALAKLSQAESHLRNADALRVETQAMVDQQVAALELQRITAMDALRSIAPAGTDLEQISARQRDSYEETEQFLARIITDQANLNELASNTTVAYEDAQAEVVRIREAIRGAVDGMVTFDGEVISAVDLTERLTNAAGGVNFQGAISDAQTLANWLNVSLSTALALSATTPMMADEDAAFAQQVIPDASVRDDQRVALANLQRLTDPILPAITTSRTGSGGGSRSSGISEAQKEYNEALREAESILSSLMTPQDEYNEALDQANRLLDVGVLPMDAYTQHVAQLKEELDNAIFSEQREMVDDFTSALLKGEDGIKSYFKTLADQAAQALVSGGIQQLLGIGGSAGGGILGGLFGGGSGGGLFAGLFDKGGNIPSGQFGIAGENGPEIIKGPANVTSTRDTAKIMQGGSQDLNVSVSVDNNGNLQAMVRDTAGQVVAQSAPQIVNQSVSAVSNQMRKSKAGFS